MSNSLSPESAAIGRAVAAIRAAVSSPFGSPKVGIVLGSGLGHLAELVEQPVIVPYAAIPGLPRLTIAGHAGNLILGQLGGVSVAMLQGRAHYYEGHDLPTATFSTRILRGLGVSTLILTAATGGIRTDLRKGDLVVLTDHLNLLGSNPLRGPNDPALGPRFPDMTAVYDPELRDLALSIAASLEIPLATGVYAALSGPSYETPAEIRMLRTLGADVVGMSTVPEAIVARHGGMKVLAFAMVTNAAAGVTGETIDHAEVIDVAKDAGERLGRIIAGVVGRLG